MGYSSGRKYTLAWWHQHKIFRILRRTNEIQTACCQTCGTFIYHDTTTTTTH